MSSPWRARGHDRQLLLIIMTTQLGGIPAHMDAALMPTDRSNGGRAEVLDQEIMHD